MSARQIIPQTHDPCALCHKPAATTLRPLPRRRLLQPRLSSNALEACAQADLRRITTTGPAAAADAGRARRGLRAPARGAGLRGAGPLVDRDRRTALRTHARHEVERLLKLPLAAAGAALRAEDRSPEHRHAVALDLTPVVRDVVGELAVAYDACRAAFAGDEPGIVELGCLVSDAGAAAQPGTPTPTRRSRTRGSSCCSSTSTSAPSRATGTRPARTRVEIKYPARTIDAMLSL